jgi:hypothetical protein
MICPEMPSLIRFLVSGRKEETGRNNSYLKACPKGSAWTGAGLRLTNIFQLCGRILKLPIVSPHFSIRLANINLFSLKIVTQLLGGMEHNIRAKLCVTIFSRVGKQLKRPKEYTTLEHLSSQSHDSSPPNGQSQDIVD